MEWNIWDKVGAEIASDKKSRTRGITLNGSLSLLLRSGVILSAIVIGFGVLLFVLTGQSGYALDVAEAGKASSYITFHATISSPGSTRLYFPTSPVEIWEGVVALKPFAIIMLGLAFLIATPVLNVALAGFGFIKERNRVFSLISLFVLAILILSFFLGKAGG